MSTQSPPAMAPAELAWRTGLAVDAGTFSEAHEGVVLDDFDGGPCLLPTCDVVIIRRSP